MNLDDIQLGLPRLDRQRAAPDLSSSLPSMPVDDRPKGMFGIHGTGRDLLGLLGDAFLVQSGNQPVYAPRHEDDQEAAAMGNFVDNPMAAAVRLAQQGHNPAAARDFYLKAEDDARVKRKSDQDYQGTVLDRGLRMLGAANQGNYQQVRAQVEDYLDGKGVQLPMALPDSFDPDAILAARKMAYPVDKQIDDENNETYRGRRMDLLDQRLGLVERGQDIGRDNNIRNNRTSHDNNVRTTGQSNTNNVRSTGQSNTNNIRTTGQSDTNSKRTAQTADTNLRKKVVARVKNDRGEEVVLYTDGTVQTAKDSRPLGDKRKPDRSPHGPSGPGSSPANPVKVTTRSEALALPPGTYVSTPAGPFRTPGGR